MEFDIDLIASKFPLLLVIHVNLKCIDFMSTYLHDDQMMTD